MSKRTRLLSKLKHVYSHNTKLVLDVSNDDIGLIIEGVEKQIGKKPIIIYEHKEDNGLYDLSFMCLSCDMNSNGQYYRPNYCKHCGQKIDWSEADEDEVKL